MVNPVVISPEPFIQKCRSLAKTKDAYLSMIDGDVSLTWTVSAEGGAASRVEFMERCEAFQLGITYDLLLEAIEECEGKTDRSGHYPTNDAIRQRLKKTLKGQED